MTDKKTTDKTNTKKSPFLVGKLLVAMPGMSDEQFEKSAIFMCTHDEKGAMGLIVNENIPNIDFDQLLSKLKIEQKDEVHITVPVLRGGPLDESRGFVLHGHDFKRKDTIHVDDRFGVTCTIDALKAIAGGTGPHDAILMLGYSGWDAGQLEEELKENSWIIVEADRDILFNTKPADVWRKALAKIGVNPDMVSHTAGHA